MFIILRLIVNSKLPLKLFVTTRRYFLTSWRTPTRTSKYHWGSVTDTLWNLWYGESYWTFQKPLPLPGEQGRKELTSEPESTEKFCKLQMQSCVHGFIHSPKIRVSPGHLPQSRPWKGSREQASYVSASRELLHSRGDCQKQVKKDM